MKEKHERAVFEALLVLLTEASENVRMRRHYYWKDRLNIPNDDNSARIIEIEEHWSNVVSIIKELNYNFNLNQFRNRGKKSKK